MNAELLKALMNTGDNSNLFQEDLHPTIYNILQQELPLWTFLGTEQAQGPIHQWRVRTALPAASMQGEIADSDFRTATYTLKQTNLKIARSWGGVSSFMQATTQRWLDALSESISASVEGLANLLEMQFLFGNDADVYQFDGLEANIMNDSVAKLAYASGGNIYDVNAAFSLTHLDAMIDRMKGYRGGDSDRHLILASRPMISRISALQTRVTRDVAVVEFEGGFRMASYRGVGLWPCDIVTPAGTTTSPTVVATAAAGGALADDEYFYALASVTLAGEQKAGVVDSATTATTNNSVDLTWTADAAALQYKVYRGLTSTVADMELLAVIPGKTYDSAGNVTGNLAAWSDEGGVTPLASVHPFEAGHEMLVGVNVSQNLRGNRILGAVSPLGDPMENFVSYVPLATINGSYRYMLETFLALKVPYPRTNFIVRRAKLA